MDCWEKDYNVVVLNSKDQPKLLSDAVFHGTLSSEKEEGLELALERRASEGLELALRTDGGVGSLPEITRVFRENGLTIRRAEISPVGAETIDSIRRQLGRAVLSVKQKNAAVLPAEAPAFVARFFRASLQSFRLIRSCS